MQGNLFARGWNIEETRGFHVEQCHVHDRLIIWHEQPKCPFLAWSIQNRCTLCDGMPEKQVVLVFQIACCIVVILRLLVVYLCCWEGAWIVWYLPFHEHDQHISVSPYQHVCLIKMHSCRQNHCASVLACITCMHVQKRLTAILFNRCCWGRANHFRQEF